jgi:hypothetical protein
MPTDQQKLLRAGFNIIGKSKGLEEVVYSKKMDNKTTLNVYYLKNKMSVYLSQKKNKVYLHHIKNIEQLFQFQNQLQ